MAHARVALRRRFDSDLGNARIVCSDICATNWPLDLMNDGAVTGVKASNEHEGGAPVSTADITLRNSVIDGIAIVTSP